MVIKINIHDISILALIENGFRHYIFIFEVSNAYILAVIGICGLRMNLQYLYLADEPECNANVEPGE
jgi:hypothetical protein